MGAPAGMLLLLLLGATLVCLTDSQMALKDMEFAMCCQTHKFERNVTKNCNYDLLYRLFTIRGGNTPRNDQIMVPHPFTERYKDQANVTEPYFECLTRNDTVMDCCEANKLIRRECFVWCKPGLKSFYEKDNECQPKDKKNSFSIAAAIYCHYFNVRNNYLIGHKAPPS